MDSVKSALEFYEGEERRIASACTIEGALMFDGKDCSSLEELRRLMAEFIAAHPGAKILVFAGEQSLGEL